MTNRQATAPPTDRDEGCPEALLQELQVRLDCDRLRLALTHRSFAYEQGGLPTNERLEFLGDSVLGLAVTGMLFHRYAASPESDLARMRSAIVSTRALAEVARHLGEAGLGPFVLLGRGERLSGGADKDSILADTLEAVIGAVYEEHGFPEARDLVKRLFGEAVRTAREKAVGTDWKTRVQEEAAARQQGPVEYQVVGSGPDHERSFDAVALLGGEPYGRGTGRSKKEAEQEAAEEAYLRLTESAAVLDHADEAPSDARAP